MTLFAWNLVFVAFGILGTTVVGVAIGYRFRETWPVHQGPNRPPHPGLTCSIAIAATEAFGFMSMYSSRAWDQFLQKGFPIVLILLCFSVAIGFLITIFAPNRRNPSIGERIANTIGL